MIPIVLAALIAAASPPPAPAASDCESEARILNPVSATPATLPHLDSAVTAIVAVQLRASGNVASVSIFQSSGFPELDKAAMTAARESTYAPKMHDCKPIEGSYVFESTFTPY